jgi:hypothetical protein
MILEPLPMTQLAEVYGLNNSFELDGSDPGDLNEFEGDIEDPAQWEPLPPAPKPKKKKVPKKKAKILTTPKSQWAEFGDPDDPTNPYPPDQGGYLKVLLATSDPLACFKAFLTPELADDIATESNIYPEQTRQDGKECRYQKMDAAKVYSLIGVIFNLGLYNFRSTTEHWNGPDDGVLCSGISNIISQKKWEAQWKYLH